jgi:signal transduction histidine kinase
MSHYEESVDAFEKSIPLMRNIDQSVLLEIYPYYCDALDALHQYDKLESATVDWKKVIDHRLAQGDNRDLDVILANYFIACAQGKLGLNRLEEAEELLNETAIHVPEKNNYEWLYLLFYRAKLRMLQGRYEEALELNAERLAMCSVINDKPTLIPVHKQRADILMLAGRYKEAAEMYARTFELSDSLNRANTRTQLNELRTIFKVDELENTNARRKSQFVTIISVILTVALLIIMLLIWLAARKLRHKNRELAQRNKELKVASERAEESLKMKTDFIHQISHEIRTPLNVLSGFSQILTADSETLDADTRHSINHRIVESTDRITNLVSKMLELSEASSETIIEREDQVTPVRIADEAIIAIGGLRGQKNLCFDYQVAPAVQDLHLKTNLKQASRTLQFLLGNAKKFLHPQGVDTAEGTVRLLVDSTADKQFIQFVVEDTGKGVPAEEAEHIFEEFVQLDEYYEGAGIGLTVARSIARRLGGDVVLDTAYTDGARFVFTLPNT